MYFFFCLATKEKDTKKKKSRLHFLRYSTSYFSGTKRTRYAQTAFCPYPKNTAFRFTLRK